MILAAPPPLDALLPCLLRRDHTSYSALQDIRERVEASETAGDPRAGLDFLLLAEGILRNDSRVLQEYMRMHGNKPPESVRARLTPSLTQQFAEAARRNQSQEWATLLPRLSGPWERRGAQGCQLYANGLEVGPLSHARLRVTPQVPQRLHVVCPNGFHVASTVIPVASAASQSEIEVVLSSDHGVVLGQSAQDEPEKPEGMEARKETGKTEMPTWRGAADSRLGIQTGLIVVGGPPARVHLHNLGLKNGIFARGGLRWTTSRYFVGLQATRVSQRRVAAERLGKARNVWAVSLDLGVVAWRPDPAVSIPLEVGFWHWRCASRPCGFLTSTTNITLGAGVALQLPSAGGLTIEISASPGIVATSSPLPFFELRTQVSLDR